MRRQRPQQPIPWFTGTLYALLLCSSASQALELETPQSQYSPGQANQEILTLAQYWADYRAAYTLSINQKDAKGPRNGHRFQINYLYGDKDQIGLALSLAEYPAYSDLGSKMNALSLVGSHQIGADWLLTHTLSCFQQDSGGIRQALQLSFGYRF